jgi:hypothetical protein
MLLAAVPSLILGPQFRLESKTPPQSTNEQTLSPVKYHTAYTLGLQPICIFHSFTSPQPP